MTNESGVTKIQADLCLKEEYFREREFGLRFGKGASIFQSLKTSRHQWASWNSAADIALSKQFGCRRAGLPMLKLSNYMPRDRRARLPEREMGKDYVRQLEYIKIGH